MIKSRLLGSLANVSIAVALFAVLYLSSLYSYLLFHTLVELISIIIACTLIVLAWNFRRFYKDSFLTFIGVAYLFCGIIDLFHTLAYKGMAVFHGYDTNLPTQLWIAARYMQSLALLAAPLFLRRRVKMGWIAAGFLGTTVVLLLSIFIWKTFPICYIEGVGLTPFKITSEYIINLILIAATGGLLLHRDRLDRKILQWMILSIVFTIIGELAFTFYIDVYGFSNLLGHFAKIIAYYLVYKALIETEAGTIYTDMTQLLDTREALRESERQLRQVGDHLPEGAIFRLLQDHNGTVHFEFISAGIETIAGVPAQEIMADSSALLSTVLPEDSPPLFERVIDPQAAIGPFEMEMRQRNRVTGAMHWSLLRARPNRREAGITVWDGVQIDITERKAREKELNRLNRTLRALNKSSQSMIHAVDESGFMQEVCDILTQDCGYTMVWIGFAEQDEGKSVRPVAFTGFEKSYLDTLQISWSEDNERGRGPTGTAIRSGKPSICRNMLTDPKFLPCREQALQRGYAASLVLPLLAEEKAFGVLAVYSREPDPFTEDEVRFLSEMANDLAHGITTLRIRSASARVEKALQESTLQYRQLFEGMTEGFALHETICDDQGRPCDYRFLEVNPAFERLTGLRQAELVGRLKSEMDQLRAGDPVWEEVYRDIAPTREPVHFERYSPTLQVYFEVFTYAPSPDRFAAIFINVTERRQNEAALQQIKEDAERIQARIEVQRRLIEQREQERLQIARDLHDGPLQTLIGINFAVQGLALDAQNARLKDSLENARAGLQETTQELRAYAQNLRPPALFTFGLKPALRSHLETFQSRHPELHTHLEINWDGGNLPETTTIALYRIVQESLNNIAKHAQASEVKITLQRSGSQVQLDILDDGVGFEVPSDFLRLARQGHLGLVGMRERAEAIGGKLDITSAPGKGTRLHLCIENAEIPAA